MALKNAELWILIYFYMFLPIRCIRNRRLIIIVNENRVEVMQIDGFVSFFSASIKLLHVLINFSIDMRIFSYLLLLLLLLWAYSKLLMHMIRFSIIHLIALNISNKIIVFNRFTKASHWKLLYIYLYME